MNSEITIMSAVKLTQLIQQKKISAYDVTSAYIKRISQVNQKINALIQFDPEDALACAQRIDHSIAEGKRVGPLAGVPISIKDMFNVRGFVQRRGSFGFPDVAATEDDPLVSKLRAAGAVILGITNIPEFGASFETDNDVYGRTNNPYNLDCIVGGSSGGEAAIIAAGGSALGLGNDACGSVRLPAHFNGICGMKPTQNTIEEINNWGIFQNILCSGPMARYVCDLKLAWSVLKPSGTESYDPRVAPIKMVPHDEVDLNKLRIAYYTDDGICPADADTCSIMMKLVASLKEKGATVIAKAPPQTSATQKLLFETFIQGGDGGTWQKDMLKQMHLAKPSPLFAKTIAAAEKVKFSVTELRNRFSEIEALKDQMQEYMHDIDIILSPTTATAAFAHGESHQRLQQLLYPSYYNLLGNPAITVPCGRSEAGMPIGLMVVGRKWQDEFLLSVAALIEEISGGYQPPDL